MRRLIPVIGLLLGLWLSPAIHAQDVPANAPIRVLLIDGQNNHYIWPKTSEMMKSYLEETDSSQ